MAAMYAILRNLCKFKYQIIFSASFYKINEEDQGSDVTDLFFNLSNNHKLTETDNFDIDVKPRLEHQRQIQETKESRWIFDKINSMTIRFHKSGELN